MGGGRLLRLTHLLNTHQAGPGSAIHKAPWGEACASLAIWLTQQQKIDLLGAEQGQVQELFLTTGLEGWRLVEAEAGLRYRLSYEGLSDPAKE